MSLRSKTIRLAFVDETLRPYLLPILRRAGGWETLTEDGEPYQVRREHHGTYTFTAAGELLYAPDGDGPDVIGANLTEAGARRRADEHHRSGEWRPPEPEPVLSIATQLRKMAEQFRRDAHGDLRHRYEYVLKQLQATGSITPSLRRALNRHNKAIGSLRAPLAEDNELMARGLEMIADALR